MPTVGNKDIGSWNLSLKMNEMNETFNEHYILIDLNIICTSPEGRKVCLDAWIKQTTHEEGLFTWFYFQIIEIKEIFEKLYRWTLPN